MWYDFKLLFRERGRSVEDMVDQQSRDGTPDGSSVVAGRTWQRLISSDGRTKSLVLQDPDATTILSADLPYEALEAYASTLSTSD